MCGWYCFRVNYSEVLHIAFLDELEKIAVSSDRLRVVAQGRKGRRPISVSTFLKKDKDGTLFKHTGNHEKVAGDNLGQAGVPWEEGVADPGAATKPKKRGEVPTKEDHDAVTRMDGRGEAATVYGQGQTFTNIAATGQSNAGLGGT